MANTLTGNIKDAGQYRYRVYVLSKDELKRTSSEYSDWSSVAQF